MNSMWKELTGLLKELRLLVKLMREQEEAKDQ